MVTRKTKRMNLKQKNFLSTLVFFLVTITMIGGLIAYLWVYTEVDEALIALEIQSKTVIELKDEIKILHSEIQYLKRVDVISKKVNQELGMVVAMPETIMVYIEPEYMVYNND
jgi:cell division protein FtsB